MKQGLNRFVWDMRYPDAKDFPGIDHVGRQRARPGGAAGTVPGAADGGGADEDAAVRASCAIRWARATDADLSAQFVLASQISGKVSAANDGGAAHPRS